MRLLTALLSNGSGKVYDLLGRGRFRSWRHCSLGYRISIKNLNSHDCSWMLFSSMLIEVVLNDLLDLFQGTLAESSS